VRPFHIDVTVLGSATTTLNSQHSLTDPTTRLQASFRSPETLLQNEKAVILTLEHNRNLSCCDPSPCHFNYIQLHQLPQSLPLSSPTPRPQFSPGSSRLGSFSHYLTPLSPSRPSLCTSYVPPPAEASITRWAPLTAHHGAKPGTGECYEKVSTRISSLSLPASSCHHRRHL
jgi:hypothetical protein